MPLILFPISAMMLVLLAFVFVVPAGSDLISPQGDFMIGQILSTVFFFCLVIDIVRFFKKEKGITI